MPFSTVIALTIKCYNRIVTIFYADAPYLPRPLKALSCVAQYLVLLVLTGVSTISIPQDSLVPSIFIPFLLMKPVFLIFLALVSHSTTRKKALCKNIAATILAFGLFIGMHILAVQLTKDTTTEKMDSWSHAFVASFFVEAIGHDVILFPLLVKLYLKYSKNGIVDLSPAFL